jgi:hypothetical protein
MTRKSKAAAARDVAALPEEQAPAEAPAPGRHPLFERRIWLPLALLVAVVQLPFLHLALRGEAEASRSVPFSEDFTAALDRGAWWASGGHWRTVDGWLYSPGVKNNPLWLKAKLPRDVAIEFDARSESPEGDLKVEVFGDGRDHASGYILIHGGWKNTVTAIARLNEHGRDRKERKDLKVEKSKTYRWRIERKGALLRWLIDGAEALRFEDAEPLEGRGHDRFGFSSWESELYFDNLKIEPL